MPKTSGLLVEVILPVQPVKMAPTAAVAVSVTTESGAYLPPWSGKGSMVAEPPAGGLLVTVRL